MKGTTERSKITTNMYQASDFYCNNIVFAFRSIRLKPIVVLLTGLLAFLLGSQTAVALHGVPILVDTLPNPTYTNSMRGADILTDDSAGNAYLIYISPPQGLTPNLGVALAKITPTGAVTKVQLVGPASTSPLLATVLSSGGPVARIHNDVLYVFMIVTMPDSSIKYLAAKCADLANIGSAACWTKLDGSAGVDLLPFEGDFDFGMDIDSSGKVYISGTQGNNVRVRNFTSGVGWSVWQLVGSPGVVRFTDIEADDDTGIVHVVAGDGSCVTIYSKGASPGAIPSGPVTVTTPTNCFFVGQGGIATFFGNKVLILGSSGPENRWNFFDGATWIFGTSGTAAPFGSTGTIENLLVGAVSKAPDGKGKAFTLFLEGGQNKYQLRTFDPVTQSWSTPTTIYTTPPPVEFSIRSILATRLDPNPNSNNQWFVWFDPHQSKLFADFESFNAPIASANGPYSCDESSACTFDGSGSSDPDPGDSIALYEWDFDYDGITFTVDASGAVLTNPSHIYADGPDSKIIALRVTDSHGVQSGIATAAVTVHNVAPMVNAGPDATLISGQTFNLNAGFSDSGINDAPWSFTIDWGDGFSSSGSTSTQGAITGSHQYFIPAIYTIQVCVTDKDGDKGCDALALEVKPLPVQIDIKPGSFPNSINCQHANVVIPVAILTTSTAAGESVNFDATTVDPLSVRFGRTGMEAAEIHNTGHTEDVDDGDLDMVLHFRFGNTGIQCDDTEAILTGKTTDGRHIQGSNGIRTARV